MRFTVGGWPAVPSRNGVGRSALPVSLVRCLAVACFGTRICWLQVVEHLTPQRPAGAELP